MLYQSEKVLAIVQQLWQQEHLADKPLSNICLTGMAGSGKTYILQQVRQFLQNELKRVVSTTASTGIGALCLRDIGIHDAKTLHSWSGIGLGQLPARDINRKLSMNARSNIRNSHTLIIDESGMLSRDVFELVNKVCSLVRCQKNEPFGGLHLIILADWLQLAPIKHSEKNNLYLFTSPLWNELNLVNFELWQAGPRYVKDALWGQLLQRARVGKCTEADFQLLQQHQLDVATANRMIHDETCTLPLMIHSKLAKVKEYNTLRYNMLDTEERVFKAVDRVCRRPIEEDLEDGDIQWEELGAEERRALNLPAYMQFSSQCEEEIKVRVGATVMTIVNTAEHVNGTVGTVRQMHGDHIMLEPHDKPDQYVIVTPFTNDCIYTYKGYRYRFSRTQMPIILAWAVTAHKCQGRTISASFLFLDDLFDNAHMYVMLSRLPTSKNLQIIGSRLNIARLNGNASNECAKDFYRTSRFVDIEHTYDALFLLNHSEVGNKFTIKLELLYCSIDLEACLAAGCNNVTGRLK